MEHERSARQERDRELRGWRPIFARIRENAKALELEGLHELAQGLEVLFGFPRKADEQRRPQDESRDLFAHAVEQLSRCRLVHPAAPGAEDMKRTISRPACDSGRCHMSALMLILPLMAALTPQMIEVAPLYD